VHQARKGSNPNTILIYSVWIIRAGQHTLLEVIVKGLKKCCISTATDGMLGVSVRKMQALIYKGRWNLTWFVRCMQLIRKKLFLADFYFWGGGGGAFWFWINTFSFGRRVFI